MAIRKYKPTTPGRRGSSVADFVEITRTTPEKSLTRPLPKKGGRNNQGRITVRHRGGGHKQQYRVIDFKRDKDGVPAKVHSIEYDPNRNARIALLHFVDGEKRYIIAPDGIAVGQAIENGPDAPPNVGNCLPLSRIPLGVTIHNIEMQPGCGARLCRAAGSNATLMAREADWAQITLPSGEIRRVPALCRATIGQVGNSDAMNVVIGKAGRNRWKGIRPYVRGTAMNPIDHPHGGGEGKTSGGRHPVSPWGQPEGRTRDKNKASSRMIIRRRKTGKKR